MLRRWGAEAHAAGGGGGRVREGESSGSSSDEEEGLGRAEELRRERLNALVKRNLTTILLDVTDALFGGLAAQHVFVLLEQPDCVTGRSAQCRVA